MEQHVGTKVRFVIQRRSLRPTSHMREWTEGTGQCDDEGTEYRARFRNVESAKRAVADCRTRAKSWGDTWTEFRVVKQVTDFSVVA